MPAAYSMPVVWQLNASDLYLAPTLEEAIQYSMELSGSSRDDAFDPDYGSVVSEDELESMTCFFNNDGTERTGLEVYHEMLADGKTIQPFVAVDDVDELKRANRTVAITKIQPKQLQQQAS